MSWGRGLVTDLLLWIFVNFVGIFSVAEVSLLIIISICDGIGFIIVRVSLLLPCCCWLASAILLAILFFSQVTKLYGDGFFTSIVIFCAIVGPGSSSGRLSRSIIGYQTCLVVVDMIDDLICTFFFIFIFWSSKLKVIWLIYYFKTKQKFLS